MRSFQCFSVVCLLSAFLPFCTPAVRADDAPGPAAEPVRVTQLKVDGFWKQQVKLLTEKWIPHCIRQMEAGGRGQELLNLVYTARVLRGEPAGKFTGTPWADAYVYNTIEAASLALAVDPEDDAELAGAQTLLRKKLDEWIPIVLAAQTDDGYLHSYGRPHAAELSRGYARIQRTWMPGDRVELSLPMDVLRVYADERVEADRGRVALQRGPLAYNIEDVDHDGQARSVVLKPEEGLKTVWRPELLGGVMAIEREAGGLLAVPNYVRLNRGGWSQDGETPSWSLVPLAGAGRIVANLDDHSPRLTRPSRYPVLHSCHAR